MQAAMMNYQFSIVTLFFMFICISYNPVRSYIDDICDPHTVTSESYPSLLVGLSVQTTSPLKLKATFRLPNSTKEFSFEGMARYNGFSHTAALTACRSLGCSKTTGSISTSMPSQPTCEFKCPDGTSAMQNCRIMISTLTCLADSMSLLECLTNDPFWYNPGSSTGVDIKCLECGD